MMPRDSLLAALCAAAPIAACATVQHGETSAPERAQQILRAGTRAPTIGSADNFSGHVRVEPLFPSGEGIEASSAYVTFEPGARRKRSWCSSMPTLAFRAVSTRSGS